MSKVKLTKADLIEQARSWGAELVGFASIDRWIEGADVPVDFYPHNIWPQAKTVIVVGLPLWLPIIEASPTLLGREQANVTNELLEEIAYRLAVFLKRNGYSVVNIPTTFSNSWAGYYAGLGTVGWNGTLLTPEYGPRVHLLSILTDLELAGDPLIEENLCTKCLNCKKICPTKALSGDEQVRHAQVDPLACLHHEKRLQKAFCDPCGSCIKVCPIGEDRQLFQSNSMEKYFDEQEVLSQNPSAEEYKDWVHIRNYGSFSLNK